MATKKDSQKPASKSDERNVVGKDPVDIQDIEDQIALLWEKNKGLIFGGVAALILGFLGYQGIKLYQSAAEASLREDYQQADSPAAKQDFAQSHAGSPLGGFAFKELGDQAYADGDLAQAEAHYRKAVSAAERPVNDAANIALAVALIDQGKASEARAILQPIAGDPTAAAQAEAQYRLAQLASQEGDYPAARSYVEEIAEDQVFWKSRARALESSLPKADA